MPTNELIAEIGFLRKKLGEAEGLLRESEPFLRFLSTIPAKILPFESDTWPTYSNILLNRAIAFLTPTQAQEDTDANK